MNYYFSSAGYIVSPDSRRIARIKEFAGWRETCQDICVFLNEGFGEKVVLKLYQNKLEPETWKPSN